VPDESNANVVMSEQLIDLATLSAPPAGFNASSPDAAMQSVRNIVSWTPIDSKSIRGCVLIAHGLHEHSLRYQLLANTLACKGYVVFAIDHVSHGLSWQSNGAKALVPSFETLRDDYVKFFQYVNNSCKQLGKEVPYFLFGHSMGTLVTLLAANKIIEAAGTDAKVLAVALSGVPLNPGYAAGSPFGLQFLYPMTKTSAAKSLASALASMDPNGPAAPIMIEGISSDETQRKILLKDTRRYAGEIRNKTAFELLKMIDAVKSEVPNITSVPFFLIHGKDDTIALPEGSQWVFDNVGCDKGGKQKEIHIKDGLRHEVLHEGKTATDECIQQIINFIDQHNK
jgi:acylglycerol lipase